jgi:hypothetical protein
MFGSVRCSAREVQTRNAGFFCTLLVVVLFSLFPATSSSQETAGNGSPKAGSSTAASSGVDILSDTRGVDFGPYGKQVIQSTRGAWLKIIPESARPPQDKQGRVGIRFKIDPMGRVNGMVLEYPSGDIGLDRAAWGVSPAPRRIHLCLLSLLVPTLNCASAFSTTSTPTNSRLRTKCSV